MYLVALVGRNSCAVLGNETRHCCHALSPRSTNPDSKFKKMMEARGGNTRATVGVLRPAPRTPMD